MLPWTSKVLICSHLLIVLRVPWICFHWPIVRKTSVLSSRATLRRSYWCQGQKNECKKGLYIKGFPWLWTHIQTGFQVTDFFIVRTYPKPRKYRVEWTLLLFDYRVDEITVKKVASWLDYCFWDSTSVLYKPPSKHW